MATYPRPSLFDVSLVLCGAAGQGVQTVEQILVKLAKVAGYHVFASREYMSRVRGGSNSTTLRISSLPVRAQVDRIDVLLPLNGGLRPNILQRIDGETTILGDPEELGDELQRWSGQMVPVPLLALAREAGQALFANVVAAGMLAALLEFPLEDLENYFRRRFGAKSPDLVEKNLVAGARGYAEGEALRHSGRLVLDLIPDPAVHEAVVVSGTEAVALGALAGGCDFCCGYPMSPATGVLQYLIAQGRRFGVVTEQAEDEIAAINMAVGASYAGAHPLVSTSGGGFALMGEGLSLAGITECPVVIHLAQRPGPATGMATRTEQGDLDLALYAGHGEFPRAIFAPGTLEEAFLCTQRAFAQAAKWQVPALVLTDQYLVDLYYDLPVPDLDRYPAEDFVGETEKGYVRYAYTENGVSPRGVPGYGMGLVGADSHEHDVEGHVREDFDMRREMHAKRLRKLDGLARDALAPLLTGPADYRNLVVVWGSSRHMAEEALERMGRGDTALLSFSQVYPLHASTQDFLARAERVVVLEGNATGQFARLLWLSTGRKADAEIRWWNGLALSVEWAARELEGALSGSEGRERA